MANYYTRPTHDEKQAQADLARAVFGIGYTFDSRTEFNSEFEVEHAVSSATDAGRVRSGAVLYRSAAERCGRRCARACSSCPSACLNEHHEPTNFYGVQRNFVETLIIPSTWREGGFNLHGDTAVRAELECRTHHRLRSVEVEFRAGVSALHHGARPGGQRLGAAAGTHQELALANAQHLSQYVALGYYGVPGLTARRGHQHRRCGQGAGAAQCAHPRQSAGHAVGRPCALDAGQLRSLRALCARLDQQSDHRECIESGLAESDPVAVLWLLSCRPPTPPGNRTTTGWLPFARWERYDMGSRYEGTAGPVVPTGLVPISANPGDYGYWPINHDRVWTVGANFYMTPHVVFKARLSVVRDQQRLHAASTWGWGSRSEAESQPRGDRSRAEASSFASQARSTDSTHLVKRVGDRGALATTATLPARRRLPIDAVVIAAVLRRPRCRSRHRWSRARRIAQLDDAGRPRGAHGIRSAAAAAEHGQIAARIDQPAVASRRAHCLDGAIDRIALGDPAEIDVARGVRDHPAVPRGDRSRASAPGRSPRQGSNIPSRGSLSCRQRSSTSQVQGCTYEAASEQRPVRRDRCPARCGCMSRSTMATASNAA